jgi:hypothetical protein
VQAASVWQKLRKLSNPKPWLQDRGFFSMLITGDGSLRVIDLSQIHDPWEVGLCV